MLKTDAVLDNSFIMCWFSGQNLFVSSSELSEFIKDMCRFYAHSYPCDDEDGSSDSWVVEDGSSDSYDVDIGGPKILQIFFFMSTLLNSHVFPHPLL